MTYREPAKRLWNVHLAWSESKTGVTCATSRWVWAFESDLAIDAACRKEGIHTQEVFFSYAICGEDFAERELAGPPKEKT